MEIRQDHMQGGALCRKCQVPFSASTIPTPDGDFVCRVLFCDVCKVILDKSWWATPNMMARKRPERDAPRAVLNTEVVAKAPALPGTIVNSSIRKAQAVEEEFAKAHYTLPGTCHCSLCGKAGHNRRTCPASAPKVCFVCDATETPQWRTIDDHLFCNACGIRYTRSAEFREEIKVEAGG